MAIKIEELKCCIDVILRLEHKLEVVKDRQKIEPIEIESLQYDVDLLRKWAGIEHPHERKAKLDIPHVINCTDLEPDYIEALNQLIGIHRKPTKKRF